MTKHKIGDIIKWRGVRNSDTGNIDYGYLYICKGVKKGEQTYEGRKIIASTRSQAVKIYKNNR